MARIFVSHSSKDNEAAATFLAWLRTNGFDEVFLDFDRTQGIPPGDEWEKRLYGEIQRATAVTLLLTKNWFESKWCFAEFTQARAQGKSILPVVVAVDGNQFIGDNLQKISLVQDRDEGLARLLDRLRDISMEGPSGFRLPAGRSPYPGMMSFDRDDAAIYFGRVNEVRATLEQLEQIRRRGNVRMLVVHGESGAGKSSLLKAGLLPHLERRASEWIALPPFRPGLRPSQELGNALRKALGGTDLNVVDSLLADPTPATAAAVVEALHRSRKEFQATVLVTVDQYEESLSLPDAAERQRFNRLLTVLLDPSLKTLAVATLRTTDLPQADAQMGIASEQRLLGAFPLDRLPEIVRNPARVAGIEVDDGLVASLLADARSADALPLVAFLLRRLYDRHAHDYKLTRTDYEALGDQAAGLRPLETCVRDAADEAIRRIGPSDVEEAALREAFVPGLVRLDDRNQFVRRGLPIEQIPPLARRLIDGLVDARLLVRRDDSVEVVHEAFFRVWPPLQAWVEEEREFLVGLTRLDAAVVDWRSAASTKQGEALLTGLLLTRCEAWLEQTPQRFSAVQREMIEASTAARLAAAARRRRLQQTIVSSSLAAAVLLAALGGVAWVQRNEALLQTQRATENETEAKLASAAARQEAYFAAISLASEKLERGRISEVRKILASAPVECRNWEWGYLNRKSDLQRRDLIGHNKPVYSAAFSSDGSKIVTASQDQTARVWATDSGQQLFVLKPHDQNVESASFSHNGKWIVTTSTDGFARLWDASTGLLKVKLQHGAPVYLASFSFDDSLLVTATAVGYGADQEVAARVWDVSSERELCVLLGHSETISSVAFNLDGTRVVTASWDGTASIWDSKSGLIIHTVRPGGNVHSAEYSPDGTRILTASTFGSSPGAVWDVAIEEPVVSFSDTGLKNARFDRNGKRIITASLDRTARIWDSNSGEQLAVLIGHSSYLLSGAFSHDGTHAVTASHDKTVRVWDATSGRQIVDLPINQTSLNVSATFSPDGKKILTAAGSEVVHIWNASPIAESILEHEPEDVIVKATFGSKGHCIYSQSDVGDVREWNVSTQSYDSEKAEFLGESARSNDGGHIVKASSEDSVFTPVVIDANSKLEVLSLAGHDDRVNTVAYSHDERLIVTSSDDSTVRVWDAQSGQMTLRIDGNGVKMQSAAFSPDRTRLITTSSDNVARLWDASNGREIIALRGHNVIDGTGTSTAVFSRDGLEIVTAMGDANVRIWTALPWQ